MNDYVTDVMTALGKAIDEVNDLPFSAELSAYEPTILEITRIVLRFRSPMLLAKILVENMAGLPADPDTFGEAEKLFWAKVSFEFGPDWIAKFRRIGAFMSAIDKA